MSDRVTISTEVVKFFSEKLGVEKDEEIKRLVDSFISSKSLPPAVKTESSVLKKTLVKRVSSTSSNSDCGKCAYVIKKKTGELEVCEKNAKNQLDGKFYCGTADKAGHYLSTLKNNSKKNPDTSSVASVNLATSTNASPVTSASVSITKPTESSKPSKPATTGGSGTNSASLSVLQKLQQNRKTTGAPAAFKVPGTEFYIIRENRVLMNIKTNEAYGILDEDNNTVKSLTSEAIAFLKEKNIFYTLGVSNGVKGQEDAGDEEDEAVVVEDEDEEDEDVEDDDEDVDD